MNRRTAQLPRNAVAYGVGTLLGLAGAYLLFELGRYQAGYSILDQRKERAESATALLEREETIEELRRQIALLETSREIDRETYAEVEATLSDLQARIQAQEEELVFYQGIVSPDDGIVGLRIQNLEISQGDREQRYTLRMVLVQAIIHDRNVAGVVKFNISGTQNGEPRELDIGELVVDGESRELAYAFRYFQALEQNLVLPPGFEPDQVEVEIWPSEPRGQQVSQSFQWSAVVT